MEVWLIEISPSSDLTFKSGSRPIPSLERLPRVRIHYVPELPRIFRCLPFLLLAPFKVVHQVVNILLCLLVWIDVPPEFILVQVSTSQLLIVPTTYEAEEPSQYSDSGPCPIRGTNLWQQNHYRLA